MRTIIITGCSSGIGWACAELLLADGWHVHATARKPEDLERLSQLGVHAHFMDYADEASIHTMFETVLEQSGGRIDALFNNGAHGQPGAVEDLSTSILRDQFEVNFFGWHELTRLCLPVMREQGHGRIVFCSSVLGIVAAPWRGAYNASKFAIEGLAATLRLELAETDIHVSIIQPGPVDTRFSDTALAKFKENIDIENSVHQTIYKSELKRLSKGKSNATGRFTVPSAAIYKKLDHALNSKRPKPHYPITVPTHIMRFAKRILPQQMIDWIVLKGT